MSDPIRITIDGQTFDAKPGSNLLQECLGQGLDLPYFCWHPCLGSVGACRQCAVKQYKDADDSSGTVVMACMTPVSDGARISIKDEEAVAFRARVIESLMISHPHDCPVCEEGGECHLQDMTLMSGHNYRRYDRKKVTHHNQYLGPFINHEMNRCIACYRCVRFYNDYAGGTDLSAQACHHHVYFGRYEDGVLENEFSGNLVEVCPTGVFTDKVFSKQYVRKWDLQTAPSVCTGCAAGCNTAPGEREGSLRRIVNRYNHEVNGYFLCDRGRFGAGYVNSPERFSEPSLPDTEVAALLQRLQSSEQGEIVGIGSPRASNEANFALRDFVGVENFYAGCSDSDFAVAKLALEIARDPAFHIPGIKQAESADAVLILGEDVTNTMPRLALALRQSVRSKALAMADAQKIPQWQDIAVRDLAQHQRSPLVIVGSQTTRLDDVASDLVSLPPDSVAAFGFAVSRIIDGAAPAPAANASDGVSAGLDEAQAKAAQKIADILMEAKQPLIVAGGGLQRPDTLRAAANMARAVGRKTREHGRQSDGPVWLCPVLPEVNSLGAAMLSPADNALSVALQRLRDGKAKHAIVLENDLFRRAEHATVEAALTAAETVLVLEQLPTATTAHASCVLPVSSFNEHNATYVNYEGRAQLSLQVQEVDKTQSHAKPAWQWLKPRRSFADTVKACAESCKESYKESCKELAALPSLLPDPDALAAGMKLPRQPHRYSGRTAMLAHVNVHEPKQAEDKESVLAFSMEGIPPQRDSSLIASSWAPGWNSNQSVSKFQAEINGELQQGNPGLLLFAASSAGGNLQGSQQGSQQGAYYAPISAAATATASAAATAKEPSLQLAPAWQIFGSDELSARSAAIQERMCSPYVTLAAAEAQRLKLRAGDSVALSGASKGSAASHGSATVRIEEGEERVPEGVAVVYGGTASAVGDDDGLDLFALGSGVKLKRVAAASADPAAGADVNAHAQSTKELQ